MKKSPVVILIQNANPHVGSQRPSKTYTVKSLEGTTSYDIGQTLTDSQVNSMIAANWTVKIVSK